VENKKDIFNGKIIEYEIRRVKFTLIYIPSLLFVIGLISFWIAATTESAVIFVIFLAYFISFSAILFAFVYTFIVPTLIRSYPKYKKLTHIFIRKECFKANHDNQMLEIISTISQSMNKNKNK
jgi:hypothetical protein